MLQRIFALASVQCPAAFLSKLISEKMVKLEAGERSEFRMLLEFGNQKLIEAWTRKVYYRLILQNPKSSTTKMAQSLREIVTSLANQLGCFWFHSDRDGMLVENPNPNDELDYNPTSSSFNLLDYAIHYDNLPLGRELLVSRNYLPNDIATIILHKPPPLFYLYRFNIDFTETLEFLKSWLCYRHRPTNYSDNVLLALSAPSALKSEFKKFTESLKVDTFVPNTWRKVVAKRLAESNNLFEVVSINVRIRKNVDTANWLNWKNKSGMKELLISIYFAADNPKDFTKQHTKTISSNSSSTSGNCNSLSKEVVIHCASIITNLTANAPSPDLVPLIAHYV